MGYDEFLRGLRTLASISTSGRIACHTLVWHARGDVTVSPARRAAYEVVLRVFEEDAYADRAFVRAAADLDPRDRALAQQIAFGTVQRVRALDHGIEALGRRPVRKLDPPVR